MQTLNLVHLRSFVEVVERGSFSAAAERLNLTQPAVSLQIRQLEQRVGVPLIERVGRVARPTMAGVELLAHAQKIGEAVGHALDAVAQHAKGATGRVRLGTGATACIFLLPPILRELKRKYPGLDIVVSTGNTAEMVKAVEDNLLDLALVTLPASGRMLEITPVLQDAFVVLAPPAIELPDRVTPAALARLPVLLFEPGGNTRRIVDDWFARAGTRLAPVMSLGSVEAIKELVAAGLGCAVLPSMAVRGWADRNGLVQRALSPPLARKLAVVVRRDKKLGRGLKETLRALQALAKSRSGV